MTNHPLAIDLSSSAHALCHPVSPLAVRFTGGFWHTRWETNQNVSLMVQARHLEEYGNLDNFRRVNDPGIAAFRGKVFNDSDVYKWIEAASWALAQRSDAVLSERLHTIIQIVQQAQRPDGYLNTYHAVERAGERWSNLRDNHELYCAGHLICAALALYRALADQRLLHVATQFADLLCEVFGPADTGKNPGIDGHEIIELALVELFRETGAQRYLQLAEHFVHARGYRRLEGGWFGLEYFQDHAPFLEQERMTGHAVRALYFNAGVTDLYLEKGDSRLLDRLQAMWQHMLAHQIYVSGGLGSRHFGEALGADYELPNEQAYTETCAAIASMMWCQRMMAATADARYADLYEHTLYNAMLPGWSIDGAKYFYVNPLANDGSHERLSWYECACCPPNVARTIAALPGSVYFVGGKSLYVMLYAQSSARLSVNGIDAEIMQQTRYPWDGDIAITINAQGTFDLMLRVPGWCTGAVSISVNGEPFSGQIDPGSFVPISRQWNAGDCVRVHLPMPPRLMDCHPHVLENTGRVAILRGPILYCVESSDLPVGDLRDVCVGSASDMKLHWRADLLAGVVLITSPGQVQVPEARWSGALYRQYTQNTQHAQHPQQTRAVTVTAIPYFAWNNRKAGPMRVWMKYF